MTRRLLSWGDPAEPEQDGVDLEVLQAALVTNRERSSLDVLKSFGIDPQTLDRTSLFFLGPPWIDAFQEADEHADTVVHELHIELGQRRTSTANGGDDALELRSPDTKQQLAERLNDPHWSPHVCYLTEAGIHFKPGSSRIRIGCHSMFGSALDNRTGSLEQIGTWTLLKTRWVRPALEFEGRRVCWGEHTFDSFPAPNVDYVPYLFFGQRFFPDTLQKLGCEIVELLEPKTFLPKVPRRTVKVESDAEDEAEEGTVADNSYAAMMAKRSNVGISQKLARGLYWALELEVGQEPYAAFFRDYVTANRSSISIRFRGSYKFSWEDASRNLDDRWWTFAIMAHQWEREVVFNELVAALRAIIPRALLRLIAHLVHCTDTFSDVFKRTRDAVFCSEQHPGLVAKPFKLAAPEQEDED